MVTRVLITGKLHKPEEREAFINAFRQISRTIISNTSGILRDELLQDTDHPEIFIMLSEWESKGAWATWQQSPVHEEQTGSLKQYWAGQGVKICESLFCVDA